MAFVSTFPLRMSATPLHPDFPPPLPKPPLSLSLSAHTVHTTDTDRHLQTPTTLSLIDHPNPDAPLAHLSSLLQSTPQYPHQATPTLSRILANLHASYPHPTFSAIIADCTSNLVRIAWTGLCAYILIRDASIIRRSYPSLGTGSALHPTVHSDFIDMQDSDLLILGSDGFFSNLSDKQILAFVRPLPQGAEDTTLSIANSTCLGSWRSDDVDFIAYYLAFLAANFAYDRPDGRFDFKLPTSPNVDDVTVMCAACQFD